MTTEAPSPAHEDRETPSEPAAAPRRSSPRHPVLARVSLYGALVLAGALVIAIGPHTFFYVGFQKKLLALAEDSRFSVLHQRATAGAPAHDSGWVERDIDGFLLATPPGELIETRPLGEQGHVLTFTTGEIRLDRFAPGSLAELYRHEHEKAGGVGLVSLNDADVLRFSTETALDEYEFLWSAKERGDYATCLLTKLLLFEPGEIHRLEYSADTDRGTGALLLEYADGAIKGFVVSPEQVCKVHLTGEAPQEWTISPDAWLQAFRESTTR